MPNQFENEIAAAGKWYQRQGRLILEYLPVMTQRTMTGVAYIKRSPFDFYGVIAPQGRFLGIECKNYNQNILPVGESGLMKHQLWALEDFARAGAITFLLWKRNDETVRLFPNQINELLRIENRKSLSWLDCLRMGTLLHKGDGKMRAKWDFMEGIDL